MKCNDGRMTELEFARLPPCDKLDIIEAALMALASGQGPKQVRHGNNWVEYHPGSIPFLERERVRLTALCNRSGARRQAITIGRTHCGPHTRRYR